MFPIQEIPAGNIGPSGSHLTVFITGNRVWKSFCLLYTFKFDPLCKMGRKTDKGVVMEDT